MPYRYGTALTRPTTINVETVTMTSNAEATCKCGCGRKRRRQGFYNKQCIGRHRRQRVEGQNLRQYSTLDYLIEKSHHPFAEIEQEQSFGA